MNCLPAVCRATELATPGGLLEVETLGPHPRVTESEPVL